MTTYLVRDDHTPPRARFPVIDAHNHLWANWEQVDRVVETMDEVGVVSYCDLTANVALKWADGGYRFRTADINRFFDETVRRYPGRFYGFTMATLAQP